MTYYHLSPFGFSKFKINNHTGFGTSFYGAGVYLTADYDRIEYYANEVQDVYAYYFIYTVEVPSNANILDEFSDDQPLVIYADLVEKFNGDEIRASKEMVKMGIDGISYYSEEDGNSVVIYNPEILKIINRKDYTGSKEKNETGEGYES